MYLIDTNVWFELLLEGEHSQTIDRLLRKAPSDQYALTDISWMAISAVFVRYKKEDALRKFIMDVFVDGKVSLIRLEPHDFKQVYREIAQSNLAFDEAYQYIAAEKYRLTFVSINPNYDRFRHKNKTPAQVLE